MNCSRPGRDGSPADTTFAPTVSRNGLASRVRTGPSAFRVEISLPRPPPSPPGREPAGFPKGGCGRWRSRPARDRWACTSGGRGGRSERSADPFVPRAWRKTPTPAGTITFAGLGRWSRAAYATGTVGFCRKRARIVIALWDSAFGTAAAPVWSAFGAKAPYGVFPPLATLRRPQFRGFSGGCPPSSRGRSNALPRRRARCCEPRGCSGPRLARGAEARPPSSRASRPTFPVRHWPGRRRTGASPWPRRRWGGGW